jgi:hypothetical protein
MPRFASSRLPDRPVIRAQILAAAQIAASSGAAVVEAQVTEAVDAVAAEIGTSLSAIDAAIETVNTTLDDYGNRISNLEDIP